MDLRKALKVINSGWDLGISGMSSDGKGNFYNTYYIKGATTIWDYKVAAYYTGLKQYGFTLYEKTRR